MFSAVRSKGRSRKSQQGDTYAVSGESTILATSSTWGAWALRGQQRMSLGVPHTHLRPMLRGWSRSTAVHTADGSRVAHGAALFYSGL